VQNTGSWGWDNPNGRGRGKVDWKKKHHKARSGRGAGGTMANKEEKNGKLEGVP